MAVGIRVTRAQIDEWVGSTALDVKLAFERVRGVKQWLDTQTVDDLVALSYTPEEAAVIKSAFADLATAAAIGQGIEVQSERKDFTVFARRLWGLGVRNTSG